MFSVVIYSKRITDGYGVRDFDTMAKAFAFFKKARNRGFMLDLWYNPDRIDMEDVLHLPSGARLLNEV